MKQILTLFIFLLSLTSASLIYSESKDLRFMGTRVFDLMLHMLRDAFPYIGSPNFHVLGPKITGIVRTKDPTVKFFANMNKIQIDVPRNAYGFALDFLWFYSEGLVPFSGNARANINVGEISLNVTYDKTSVAASLGRISFSVNSFVIRDNGIAQILGFEETLKSLLGVQLEKVVAAYMQTDIFKAAKQHVMRAYPAKRHFIFPFPNRTRSVQFHYELKEIRVTDVSVDAMYGKAKRSEECGVASVGMFDGLRVKFPKEIIEETLRGLFVQFLKNSTIADKDLPNDSLFRLNSRGLAQVIPDLHMLRGDFDIDVNIKSIGSATPIVFQEENTIAVSDLKFKLRFFTPQEPLLDSTIAMTGYFTPDVTIQPGSSFGYVNLKIKSAVVEIKEVSTFKYTVYYRDGLKRYVESAIVNWIKPAYDNKVLANGIYVEHVGILNDHYEAVVDKNKGAIDIWINN
eukprot:TRINITY_DN10634_c0_g3_i1.p1 TRINITY_DN10634_c0_g3~~TRINITY_DN10634_c0_g3_i1.p1  ORF type:complete len:472 (+),score=58.48 TRINITY_DN10634_c0_g3_i1:43-1416(+)